MRQGNNLFRVLAADDNTEVFIDGVKVATINKGGFFEGVLNRAMTITSNNPIFVGGFKKTTGDNISGTLNNLGDPFFVVFPPTEQYMNSYRIVNAQTFENIPSPKKVYEEQYITIIIPAIKLNSLKIDGYYPNGAIFSVVPGSDYVYSTIPVSDGVHYIEADTTFGIFIYGYGQANSYGYIGGSNYKKLNFFEPLIISLPVDSCFSARGIGIKKRQNDASLSKLFIVDSLLENAQLSFLEVKEDSIRFTFTLENIYQDGIFGVYITDTLNLKSDIFVNWIPGFTVSALGFEKTLECPANRITTANGKTTCVQSTLINYGRFPQKIYRAYLKNLQIEKLFVPPLEIPSNETFSLQFCLTINSDTTFVDTLIIESECGKRSVLSLIIESVTDKFYPQVFSLKDSCNKFVEIIVTDSLPVDRGLKEIRIVENTNCLVSVLENFPLKIVIRIQVEDLSKDSYYRIIAQDSVGNFIEFADTLQGFTIQILSVEESKAYQFESTLVGEMLCKKILIYNYGLLPMRLDKIHFRRNKVFSLPPSALPISINPKEQIELPVCFNPDKMGFNIDTLEIPFACGFFPVVCQGEGLAQEFVGKSNCGTEVIGRLTYSKDRVFSGEIFPNPATYQINLSIDNIDGTKFWLKIFDIFGQKVLEKVVNRNDYYPLLTLDVSDISPGFYSLVIENEYGFMISRKFQVLPQ